jgi:hypothetical protein
VTEKRKEIRKKNVTAKQAATRECRNKGNKEERILQSDVSIATLKNTVF